MSKLPLLQELSQLCRRIAGVLLLLLPSLVGAQSQILPEPNVTLDLTGTIYAMASQSDGKVVIGGTFNKVNGVARSNLARLNADGSIDTSFDIQANNTVNAVAISGTYIYFGGAFTTVNGLARQRLARVNIATGQYDSLWGTTINTTVNAIVLNATDLYIGGAFDTVGGAVAFESGQTGFGRRHARQ